MKLLSALHKLLNEDNHLKKVDRLVAQYDGQSFPFAELRADLKTLATTLAKNASLLGTKPDQSASSIWDSCNGDVIFDVMDHLEQLRPLAGSHSALVELLKLPVFVNHQVARAYINRKLASSVNETVHGAAERFPGGEAVRWQLGFRIGDRAECPVLLMYPAANAPGEYDTLELGQIHLIGPLETLMDQVNGLVEEARVQLTKYLSDPSKWVSPEREVRNSRKDVKSLLASLDAEQRVLLMKVYQQCPELLQQELAAAA